MSGEIYRNDPIVLISIRGDVCAVAAGIPFEVLTKRTR